MVPTSENSIDLLESRLGADWAAIRKARVAATEKREQLRVALDSLDSDDTSIVVFGSLARDEFTSKSDIDEDYGFIQCALPFNVPRFLQNDIARYWRTVAVDFAYKQRQQAEKGWALRTVKLRISRKLTYVSGLLTCFSCEIDEPKPRPERMADDTLDPHPIIEHLLKYSRQTPLEILASALLPHPQLNETSKTLFATYDEFLAQLDNPEKRDRLEALERYQVTTDPLYQHMRGLSRTFQDALTKLFLEENGTRLLERTKVYGVF